MNTQRSAMERRISIRIAVQDWAAVDADRDLKFIGNAPFAGMTPEQATKMREGLVQYARSAAARTFDALHLHGHLNQELAR